MTHRLLHAGRSSATFATQPMLTSLRGRCQAAGRPLLARVLSTGLQFQAAAQSFATQERPQYTEARRVFADYTIYKGKGALCAKIIRPTWQQNSDGGLVIERPGVMLLEFAEPMAGSGTGPGDRRYNWEKKQTFALSATELGALVDPAPEGIKDMYHDPNKGGRDEGSMSKSLQVKQMQEPGSWFFGLNITDSSKQTTKMGVSVSRAEMAVLRSIANLAIPHLLGFDEVFGSPTMDVRMGTSQQASYGYNEAPF